MTNLCTALEMTLRQNFSICIHAVNIIEEQSQAIVESCFSVSNNKSRSRVVLHLLVSAGLI